MGLSTRLRLMCSEITIAAFSQFGSDLHKFYRERMKELCEHHPHLSPLFSNTVFAAASFNLGPQAICIPHVDWVNFAYGWCAVVALGNFDYTKGGHFVIPSLKLAIQFPPGSTLFIPSALLTHYNLPIAEGETRRSFTQFSAGNIFRWIAYGFQPKAVAVKNGIHPVPWWENRQGLFTQLPKNQLTRR